MPFKKGQSGNPKGRTPGTANKLTKSAREAFQHAFDASGGFAALGEWAKANKTEFYKLYARLIPVEHVGEGGEGPISTIVKHIYEGEPKCLGDVDFSRRLVRLFWACRSPCVRLRSHWRLISTSSRSQ